MDLLPENLFQILFNHLTEPLVVVKADTPNFTVIACNEQYRMVSNTVGKEIIGKSIREMYGSDNANASDDLMIQNALNQTIATKEMVKLAAVRYDIPNADNSKTEQSWWQAEYIPINGTNGGVEYIMATTHNITGQIIGRKALKKAKQQKQVLQREQALNEELAAANKALKHSQESLAKLNNELETRVAFRTAELLSVQAEAENQRDRLKRFFMQAPAGICILDGPDLIFELINPPYQQLFPGRNLLGKPLLQAIPEIKDQSIWDILQNVYRTGETFEGDELFIPLAKYENGPVENRYFNFIYQARLDAQNQVDGILAFVFEVTETVLVKQKVEESEKRLRFLLDAMPQQVWTAKPTGALDYVNQIVCDDFGESLEHIVGHGWQAFIHPDDLSNCLQLWQAALEAGNEYMVEFRLKMNDGMYKWHLGRAVPLVEDEKIELWLGTNTNIDFQKNNEQKKDEFISIASHELKTPLTSIKAFNQLMERTKDTVKLNKFVKKSAEHILRLERLIDDLLDVTKINAGKMNYNMQPFSFKQMLEDSIESVQHTSPSHQIILESAENINYTGDHFRLEQVMHNFLSNAIKYSPEGKKVIVNSKIELGNIIVSVRDFGIGIPANKLDLLFDRYYRVDNTAMRFEGLGLGLFISSEILKRHQGSFWIESEPENGSTFYFRLPLANVNEVNPNIKTDTFYQDSSITIIYSETNHCLNANWTGFQNLNSVQQGGMMLLEMLVKNNCHKILNDNRNVLGTWSEASDWAGKEWFPMMEKAGLQYFAWIFSPIAFSQLSAKKSIDVAPHNVTVQFFTDITLAEDWINSK